MQKRKLHLIGNAHLDPAWLWTWREGYAEVKATFRSALDRMNEFPEFCFTCAGAAYYSWVGESDPGMLEEIRERVKEGRWVIAGGWWIQPDCNAPCGESFARHSLYGQRLFLEMFGVTAKTGYNVDSFGHNAMLPQILKLSGMDSYVFMRPGDMEKDLPSLFWWESDDGSRVMAHRLPFSYSLWYEGYEGDPDDPEFRSKPMIERKLIGTKRLSEKLETDLMAFYGVGNHGGGPTIENLKLLNRLKSDPKWSDLLVFSSPDLYFKEQDGLGIPVVHSDLLHHAMGCYSANSEIKALNRRAEHRVLAGEKFAAMAYAMLGLDYPFDVIKKAWTYIMFNQFHDIMGGCCIKEASRDAIESFGASLSISAEVSNLALQKIAWAIDTMGGSQASVDKEKGWMLWELEDKGAPLIVFNPLSWPVSASIQAGLDVSGVTNEKGEPIPIQKVRGQKTNFSDKWDTLFIGDIPAMGYRVYWINSSAKAAELLIKSKAEAQGLVLENQFIRLELDELTGHIKSLKDKKTGLEFIKGHGAVPVSIDESDCDTWAHGKARFSGETQEFTLKTIKAIEEGPLRAGIRMTSTLNTSILVQDFLLRHDSPEIEVRVRLDLREKHRAIKLGFGVNVEDPVATYEIPYGYISRPTDGRENPGQQWIDVSGTGENGEIKGLTLLNDAKFSYDVLGSTMRMTIARSPMYADHFGIRDDFPYFLDQGIQEFKYALIPHSGDWREANPSRKAQELNEPSVQVAGSPHKGTLPQTLEFIRIDARNVIATALKRSEDNDGFILRCYETDGADTQVRIELPLLGRAWDARFGSCEIKTFWIPEDAAGAVEERNLVEMKL